MPEPRPLSRFSLIPGGVAALVLLFIAGAAFAQTPADAPRRPSGPTRIDFDSRLIKGQTNTSGAVHLIDRKKMAIESMVKKRVSFRHLTLRSVYDR